MQGVAGNTGSLRTTYVLFESLKNLISKIICFDAIIIITVNIFIIIIIIINIITISCQ